MLKEKELRNMENKDINPKTIYVEPNKPPFQNRFAPMQVEIMEGFVEQIRDMSIYRQYEKELQRLTLSGATLQDRADFEVNYIKRDIDRLGQCYFKSYMSYFEYLAALMNVIGAWNMCRHNWDVQHQVPNTVPNEAEEVHQSPQRDDKETTESPETDSVK